MPNPTIVQNDPATILEYRVTNSGFAAVDINVADIDEEVAEIVVLVPAGSEVAVLRDPADWSGSGAPILTAGTWTAVPVALGDWSVSVSPGAAVTDQATVSATSAASGAGGLLRILFTALADQPLELEPGAGTLSIDRVLAEPQISSVQVMGGGPVFEKDSVTLSASVAPTVVENGAPLAPLPMPPTVLSSWQVDAANTIALPDFVDLGMNATFKAPAAYALVNLSFSVTGALDLDASGTISGSDPQTSEPFQLEIQTVRYAMVLVLDRSGSMGSALGGGISKWDVATQAAHAWTDLFRAFRPGGDHLAGVVTFEHDGCSWTPAPAGNITFRNPADAAPLPGLSALNDFGDVNTWDLGPDRTCTPIGDGLVAAWDGLGGLDPHDRGAAILMTDGYENAGEVTIADTAGPASTTFDAIRVTSALNVANTLIGDRIYTLAIGTSVDDDRLNDLGTAYYQQITNNLAEVTQAFANMLGHLLKAEELTPTPVPPMAADPGDDPNMPMPPDNPLYYQAEPGEQKLAFLVTWSSISDSLRIGWREQGDSGVFALVNPGDAGVVEVKRGTHGLTHIDLHAWFPGPPPATEWRLQHLDAADIPQPIGSPGAVVMVDLVTSAEVGFDRRQYFIGDDIKLSCNIRSGGVPVKNATVGIDAARPGEGLGTFLTTHAERYKKIKPDGVKGPDPDQGKGLMFRTLLNSLEIDDLPQVIAPQFELFDDGAHDDGPAGNGDYANVYSDTAKEGSYTFRFRIGGTLEDGSRFSRLFIRSTWVGVRPDPAHLGATWRLLDEPAGRRQASILTFRPQTAGGESLGPFRASVIELAAFDGDVDGPLVDNEDGSYSQRVLHDRGVDPVVRIEIYGTPMNPTGPGLVLGGASTGFGACWKLWVRALCCTVRWFKRLFFGR